MAPELTTVADDEIVIFDGHDVRHYVELAPQTEYEFDGFETRTLPRPPGELLCTFATVNDVHFGEQECGVIGGVAMNPDEVFTSAPGEPPYPETMNRAAIAEIAALDPAAVVVKGDLTGAGTDEEYAAFLAAYEPAFGDRLHHVRGNHDAYHGQTFADFSMQEITLDGATLALIDTTIPRAASGQVTSDQLEWLDELASRSEGPVVVFGHHHVWAPGSRSRPENYFGISPDDSERLVEVFIRRPNLVGYFAGHTHRNRARRFPPTGERPWVEVSAVKDYPGAWAEYRVYDGGIMQVFRRISAPEALAWTERTRGMFGGLYPQYSFGEMDDRCFIFA
jgi:Icc protein